MLTDLSVVLVPPGQVGRAVSEMACSWARAGLLRPSVWLSPDDIEVVGDGPARISCTYVAGSTTEVSSLFTVIGRLRLDRVRLVVVHPSGVDRPVHETLNEASELLSSMMVAALPLPTGVDDRGTEVIKVKLLVPSTGSNSIPQEVLRPDWDINALVSPEDRPDVDRGSIFVTPEVNHLGHICHAVCAVGGIWNGLERGALDTVTSDSTTSDGWLHVVRPTVRAVAGSHRIEQLADQTVRTILSGEVSEFVRWGRRSTKPEALAGRAARYLVTSQHWDVPRSLQSEKPLRDERRAGEVVGHAASYNLRLFRSGWQWLLRSSEESVSRSLTSSVVGDESGIQLVVRPATPSHLMMLSREEQRETLRTIGEYITREPSDVETPAPETWRHLRMIGLGLLDGSDLPEDVRSPAGALTEIISKDGVVPHPEDCLEMRGRRVGIADVTAYRELVADLDREEALAGLDAPRGQGGEDPDHPLQEGERDTRGDVLDQLSADRATVHAWLDRRKDSYVWQVATLVADRLTDARKRLEALEAEGRASTDSAYTGLQTAYGRLVRAWRAGVLAIPLIVVCLVVARVVYGMSGRDVLAFSLAAGVFWFAAIAVANHRYFKADLKYRRQIARTIAERRAAADELVLLRRVVSWLQVRYDGLMLWAPILGEIIHRPWGEVPQTVSTMTDDEIVQLPAAVGVAVSAGTGREEFSNGVLLDAVNVLCPPTYLRGLFDDAFEDFMNHSGRSGDRGTALLDGDELQTQASPRREFLGFVQVGHARGRAAQRAVERLMEAVEDRVVSLPPLQVKRLGPYSDGLIVTEDSYYRSSLRAATPFTVDLWTDAARAASKHLISRSLVWLPTALSDTSGPPSVLIARSAARVALRVDVSRRCTVDDVVAFQASVARADDGKSWSSDDLEVFN